MTGIVDWSDAAIVDPAYDFGLLYRDLGPAAVDVAIRGYRTDVTDVVALGQRAAFYAKCKVFEDLAYGLRRDRTSTSTRALPRCSGCSQRRRLQLDQADTPGHIGVMDSGERRYPRSDAEGSRARAGSCGRAGPAGLRGRSRAPPRTLAEASQESRCRVPPHR